MGPAHLRLSRHSLLFVESPNKVGEVAPLENYLFQREPVFIKGVDSLWPVEVSHAAKDLLNVVEQVDSTVGVVVLLRFDRPQGAHALLGEVNLLNHLCLPLEL